MTPDYATLLKGCTNWRLEHKALTVELSHHGFDDGSRGYPFEAKPGTWCYYLFLPEQMFAPEDWATLWLPDVQYDWGISQAYDSLPDFDFHGGCTFYEKRQTWDKHEKRYVGLIKVGCDYGHVWDAERGYPDTFDTVSLDAQRSAQRVLDMFPNRRTRCDYSHRWGDPSEFYTARNGRTVHRSHLPKIAEQNWDTWLPAEEAAA